MATPAELLQIASSISTAIAPLSAAVTALIAAYVDAKNSGITPATLDPIATSLGAAASQINGMRAQIEAATAP